MGWWRHVLSPRSEVLSQSSRTRSPAPLNEPRLSAACFFTASRKAKQYNVVSAFFSWNPGLTIYLSYDKRFMIMNLNWGNPFLSETLSPRWWVWSVFFFCFFLEFNVDNKVLTIAFLLVSPPLAVGRRHVPRSVASSGSGRMRQCAQLSAGWGSACLLWLFVFNQGYSVAYLCFCCQMTAWIFVKFDEVVDALRNSLSCAHREEACRGEVECRFILPGCKINKYIFKVNKEPKLDECRFPPGSQLGWRGRDNRNWDFFSDHIAPNFNASKHIR